MKKKYWIFLIAFYVYSCNIKNKHEISNEKVDNVQTQIGFSKKVIDFGTISNDTLVHAIFFVKNLGREKLIIKEVSPECSCTGFMLDTNIVLPGDSTKLSIDFNTKDKELGFQRKVISIRSNTEREYNNLFIKCSIKEMLEYAIPTATNL